MIAVSPRADTCQQLQFSYGVLAVEETGLQEKFRPYALPDDAFLAMVSERLRADGSRFSGTSRDDTTRIPEWQNKTDRIRN